MKLTIRRIKFTNFKGIRSFETTFNQETNICAANGLGKTSIFDGFTWCLFGKDSSDRKDFEVKTLDANNKVIPQLEHEVEVELQAENQVIVVKRILRETWTKRRGSTTTEFTGNETNYFWNDVPMKQKEFQDKVSGLIDENLFKLVTNPLFFNTNLKWQDRRTVLFSLSENISDELIFSKIATADNRTQIEFVKSMLNQGKSFADFKKELAAKKKKLKDELEMIPTRIDEATKSKPEPIDYTAVKTKIQELETSISDLNFQKENIVKSNQAKNQEVLNKQNELQQLKSQLQQLNFDLTKDKNTIVREVKDAINMAQMDINRNNNSIDYKSKEIDRLQMSIELNNKQIATYRENWVTENDKQFSMDDDKTICPSCRRALDTNEIHDIEQKLMSNFNESKATNLANIKANADALKQQVDLSTQNVQSLQIEIHNLNNQIVEWHKLLRTNEAELLQLNNEQPVPTEDIKALELRINSFVIPTVDPADFSEINISIGGLQNQINDLRITLAGESQINTIDARIKELQQLEGKMAQELADLENSEFVLDAFNKERINTIVSNINGKFEKTKFKLFEDQINGGEVECCEALVNTNGSWVPFSNANTAGQINAGIDIINTLCRHHDVYAPIFIDNRESVNELIPTLSQIVNLKVTLDKQLTVI